MVLSGRAVPRSEQNKKYLEISDRLAAFSKEKTPAESTEQIKFYQNNNELSLENPTLFNDTKSNTENKYIKYSINELFPEPRFPIA